MKKKLLLISILAVLIGLTGCGSNEEKSFEYDENTMISINEMIVDAYNDVDEEDAKYYLAQGTSLEMSAVKGFRQAQTTDNVGEFISYNTSEGNVKFENASKGKVLCTILCTYQNRDVEVAVTYEENLQYHMQLEQLESYVQQNVGCTLSDYVALYNSNAGTNYSIEEFAVLNDIYPYNATECEVSAVYSKSELLGQAGKNTIIGIVSVFVILIFISFIISLLKFVPALLSGKKKEAKKEVEKPAPVKAAAPKKEEKSDNLVNDAELVAVITAAIYAAETGKGASNAVSKDKLVVRSIRRVR